MLAVTPTEKRPHPWQNLGRRLAAARKTLRLSQEEVADRVGVHQTAVSHAERGRNRPEADVLQRFASVLEVDYHELAALADYIPTPPGDVAIRVPAASAPILRRLAEFPADFLQKAFTAIDALNKLDDEFYADINGTKDKAKPWYLDEDRDG